MTTPAVPKRRSFRHQTPTGSTDERHGDEVLEAEFQPGPGSSDALLGLALS